MKTLLIVSVLLNALLVLYSYVSRSTISHYEQKLVRIQDIYKVDVNALELLLKERITKPETLEIFKKHLKEDEFFDKPSESGVGVNLLFLVFGEDNVLKKIEKHDFAEK